jgi:hypothetical protein
VMSGQGWAAVIISGEAGFLYLNPSSLPSCAAVYRVFKILLNKKWNDFLSFSFPASVFTLTSTRPTSALLICARAWVGLIRVRLSRSVLQAKTTVGRFMEMYPKTKPGTGPKDTSSVES